ncbi:MAG: GNAT family N-acetyltransferase [Planctomycetota bacterium]|nr:GNAT family N-acetyltransferase [Planctomycetota bacterium]
MIEIRPASDADRPWMCELLARRWGSPRIVTRGRVQDALALPGFLACLDHERIGLATYDIAGRQCELVTLNSTREGQGAGSALVEAVSTAARQARCERLWLITTNDNLPALRFYQKRGFHLVAVHRNALEVSRRLKPELPLTGIDGIPLRDELELERSL